MYSKTDGSNLPGHDFRASSIVLAWLGFITRRMARKYLDLTTTVEYFIGPKTRGNHLPPLPLRGTTCTGGRQAYLLIEGHNMKLTAEYLEMGTYDDPVLVCGVMKQVTEPQFHVTKALFEAGEFGLSKDALDKESGHTEAHKILKRLVKSDQDWAAIIKLPGKPWGRYRFGRPIAAPA